MQSGKEILSEKLNNGLSLYMMTKPVYSAVFNVLSVKIGHTKCYKHIKEQRGWPCNSAFPCHRCCEGSKRDTEGKFAEYPNTLNKDRKRQARKRAGRLRKRCLDGQTIAANALVSLWQKEMRSYAYQPKQIMTKVLLKIQEEEPLKLYLMAPFWPMILKNMWYSWTQIQLSGLKLIQPNRGYVHKNPDFICLVLSVFSSEAFGTRLFQKILIS